jgi:Tol biopolymer transport system component
MRRLIAFATVTGMTLVGLVAVVPPSQAAFPGTNGGIAFSTDQGDTPQVFTVRPDGTGLKQLTHVAAGHAASAPSWSPDGSKIVFTIDNQVWVMNRDGSGKRQLTTHQNGFENHNPTWSPDARSIAFSHCALPFGFVAYCDIDVMNANGTGRKKILGGNWVSNNPKYSPDGTRIAFDSNRGGFLSAVWVMNADGGSLKRLTKPALEADFPGWSPDGSHIIFIDFCCMLHSNVWVIRPSGSGLKELTHFPVGHQGGPAYYSPDGRKIVLGADLAYPDECCNDLYVMNADGSNMHPILTTQPALFFSDWGPAVTP